MKFGGWQKVSFIDFPGRISTVLFTQGCNFRCQFCHNPTLVLPDAKTETIDEDTVLKYLAKRKGQLEGIVLTGGEPLIYSDAGRFMEKAKEIGYKVKLDTNGSFPELLEKLIQHGLVDYVSQDIKTDMNSYSDIVGRNIDNSKIKKSIEIIKNSGVAYEFRTTLVKGLVGENNLKRICSEVGKVSRYALQNFRPGNTLNKKLGENNCYNSKELAKMKEVVSRYAECVIIR